MPEKNKKMAYLFAAIVCALFLYILLHETGHLIVMLSVGATITEFSILTAHVSAVGGNYNILADLWLHVNGVFLPVLVAFVYILLYKREKENSFYHLFSYVFAIASTMSLLAWVFGPIMYMMGRASAGDDVTRFLDNFSRNHHSLIVSAVAVLLIGVNVTMIIKKGLVKNVVFIMKEW